MLRLVAFGGLSIRREEPGQAGTSAELLLQRRSLALLALLEGAGDAGLSRDKLLAHLWPESDEERARNALRQALHALRRDLQAPDLLIGAETLRLNPVLLASDVREFETAVRGRAFDRAAAIYAGPFLDGFHIGNAVDFERWVDRKRAEYAAQAAAAIEILAREAVGRNDAEAALRWWRRLSALDPLDARIAIGLMQALVAAGNPAGALQHARAYEQLAREELDSPLDPTIAALVERIRSGSALPATMQSIRPAAHREQLQAALAERYVFERELERGSSGRTRSFLARDLRHDRLVVLKVLSPSVASALDTERFLREIKLTARLRHPHVLPLLDSGEVEGRLWYSTLHVEGETLRERLTRQAVLPLEESLRIVREVAGALDHAHRHAIVHRDVAPESILLAEGHALLTNLGVARALDVAVEARLTDTGVLVGTHAYMSPEQAAGERNLDGRSDIYSLGCVLYELLAGEPLYSGPTPQAIMAKREVDPGLSVRALEGVPAWSRQVLLKALARRPGQRFASAAEFADALVPGAEPSPARSSGPGRLGRWLGWAGFG